MASTPLHSLLVIDDEPDLRTLYELTLLREGYDIETAGSVEEARHCLSSRRYSAVITDMRLPDGSGLDVLRTLEDGGRPEKIIVITAYGSAENAVEALRAGAYDYLTKPVDLKQFRAVVASALGRGAASPLADGTAAALAATMAAPAPHSAALQRMVGRSAAMQAVRALVEKVARSMAPVLISGESGTGKELVARAVHQVGVRSAAPFVAVNCSAIPEHLLEAEFFGYRKGAFTGAADDREGFFQAAAGGTLFLDEIGELPLAMQSKLLRAIQERAVRPVGAVAEQAVDVRLLSATHRDLGADVHAGRFRQDLYYRLNVIQIVVPPLRERLDDLPAIAGHALGRIAAEAGAATPPRLTPRALDALARQPFPGNVRELENLLHRAVALHGAESIDAADLDLGPGPAMDEDAAVDAVDATAPAPAPLPGSAATDGTTTLPTDLAAWLDAVERDMLLRALDRHRNNRTAAGAAMGLSLRQMRYRMARLGIVVGGDAPGGDGA